MGQDYCRTISASGLTIYDAIEVGDPMLWVGRYKADRDWYLVD